MLRLATDADVNGSIVRGVRRHAPGIDLVHSLEALPGLIVASKKQATGKAIEDILMIAACMSEDEIRDQVIFLPL